MSRPSKTKIRAALVDRLQNDRDPRDTDWIEALADGLSAIWPGERMPNGDLVTTLDPELLAMVESATATIALRCQDLAITELTNVALAYRDRIASRAIYRERLSRFATPA